jgi:flagellar export protein FliJ
MKTKFDSVVKVKKQAVGKIERNLQKLNATIHKLNSTIENHNKTLLSFTFPKEGNFALLNQIKHQQHILREEIQRLKNQIMVLESRKKELLEDLKKANIEYEKMKYLQAEEMKKIIKEKKLKESRDLDEIAILLRKNNESE